jgi:hypothetical protein
LSSWIFEAVGYVGAGLTLVTHALMCGGRIHPRGTRYMVGNVAALLFLSVNAIHHGAYPGLVVSGVFSLITVVGWIFSDFRHGEDRV